jgi:hypothetical protein
MAKNLDHVSPHPEPKYYGADYISGDDRAQFLEWYEDQKTTFSALLAYCMDHVSAVLFEICF